MSFDELFRAYGPWVALIVMSVSSVWATFKVAVPRLVDAYIERQTKTKNHKLTLEAEAFAADRQEDVALFSQFVNLQTRLVRQNDVLIEFLTKKVDTDLQKIAIEVHQELRDIERRWLAAGEEIKENKNKVAILSMNVAQLADNYKGIEERIASLVAYGISKNEKVNDN